MKTLWLNIFFVFCLFVPLLTFMSESFAQVSNGYFEKSRSGDKYLVALGYGAGTAYWHSKFESTEFYDKDGSVINRGSLKFSANSPTRHYDVNVLAPIKHFRLGLGISFENHFLAQLKLYGKGGDEYLIFDEKLRFDKIYLNSEFPIKYNPKKKYSFNLNVRAGWFGYSYLKRFNFIGEKPFPLAVLSAVGMTADYEIYPGVYAFAFPSLEYKLYSNSNAEAPVKIHHNVFTASIIGGLRVDLGAFNH